MIPRGPRQLSRFSESFVSAGSLLRIDMWRWEHLGNAVVGVDPDLPLQVGSLRVGFEQVVVDPVEHASHGGADCESWPSDGLG